MDFRGRHRAESFRGEFQGGSGQHQCRARGRGRRAPGRATGAAVSERGREQALGCGPTCKSCSWAFWGYEREMEPLLSGGDSKGGGAQM